MQIQIGEGVDKDDIKVVELLRSNASFERQILTLREQYGINPEGMLYEGFSFEGDQLVDDNGVRYKLNRSFPQENDEEYQLMFDEFLNDPTDFIINGKGLKNSIIEICHNNSYRLDDRWYQAVCHIILFSHVAWLPSPIRAILRVNRDNPDVWDTTGVVITVSKNISKDRLKRWVDENWGTWQDQLKDIGVKKQTGLPKDINVEIDKIILELGDQKVSFGTITDLLQKKFDDMKLPENSKLWDLVRDEQNVRMRYRRLRLKR